MGLTIAGYLDLENTPISILPERLTVGSLYIRGTDISLLPNTLKVTEDLYLGGSQVKQLPDSLQLSGELDISHSLITEIPTSLKVGSRCLMNNTNITRLPDGLKIGENLNLRYTLITVLPEKMTVKGNLYLWGTPITTLPDSLKVGKNLELDHTQISSLPDNLSIKGTLSLNNTPISVLPNNLTVLGDLELENTQISSLPDDLEVRGNIVGYDEPEIVSILKIKDTTRDNLFSMASLITGGKESVLEDIEMFFDNPNLFFTKYESHLEHWSIESVEDVMQLSESSTNLATLLFIILDSENYSLMYDWNNDLYELIEYDDDAYLSLNNGLLEKAGFSEKLNDFEPEDYHSISKLISEPGLAENEPVLMFLFGLGFILVSINLDDDNCNFIMLSISNVSEFKQLAQRLSFEYLLDRELTAAKRDIVDF
ncbi:MAG: hypothetical protein V5789_04515 [Colwellia sp.]